MDNTFKLCDDIDRYMWTQPLSRPWNKFLDEFSSCIPIRDLLLFNDCVKKTLNHHFILSHSWNLTLSGRVTVKSIYEWRTKGFLPHNQPPVGDQTWYAQNVYDHRKTLLLSFGIFVYLKGTVWPDSLFKGTQEWEFFWLRFWILYYFIGTVMLQY